MSQQQFLNLLIENCAEIKAMAIEANSWEDVAITTQAYLSRNRLWKREYEGYLANISEYYDLMKDCIGNCHKLCSKN